MATATLELDLESHRRELTGFCYRMLGSGSEAEDAVQETLIRAWKAIDGFEGRSSLRSWLYRIAHNVCINMLTGPQRRTLPMELGDATTVGRHSLEKLPGTTWVQPIADGRVIDTDGDPAEVAASRESIRLAFVAALQHLPARQRAVLILREVLRWQANEVAELLETSVASVNSALQRARATLDGIDAETTVATIADERAQQLLARYVDAFERYDIESLVSLIHEDATFCMPPHWMWLRGVDDIGKWMLGPGIGCRGSRVFATIANGCPAFAQYRPAADGFDPWSLTVLETSGDRIVAVYNFLYPELFPQFGFPLHLEP